MNRLTLTKRHLLSALMLVSTFLTNTFAAAATHKLDASFAPRFTGTMNWSPDGRATAPFGEIYEFDFQADGKIIVAGGFDAVNSIPASNIARLNPDGSTDAEFTSKIHLNGAVTSVTIDALGRILITGYFDNVNDSPFPGGVARLLSSGDLDPTFRTDFTGLGSTEGARLLADGRYLIFGVDLRKTGDLNGRTIIRISQNGTYDSSFQLGIPSPIIGSKWVHESLRAAIQPDGKLLLGGDLFTGEDVVSVMRFMPDGAVDSSFKILTLFDVHQVTDFAVLPDGRFLIAETTKISRWQTNGLPDPDFIAPADPFLEGMGVSAKGEITSTSVFSIRWFSPEGGIEQTVSTIEPWLVDKCCIRPRSDGVYIGGGWDAIAYGIWKFVPAGESYADWITQNSGGIGGPTGPSDSFFGDGVPNFLRYAFGQNLSNAWESPLQVKEDGSIRVAFNASASESRLRLLAADDLGKPWVEVAYRGPGQANWTAPNGNLTIQSQNSGTVSFTAGGSNATQFYILTVSAEAAP